MEINEQNSKCFHGEDTAGDLKMKRKKLAENKAELSGYLKNSSLQEYCPLLSRRSFRDNRQLIHP